MSQKIEKGICGICPASCGVEVTFENDRIAKIHPWKEHPQGIPCIRGQHAAEIIYSPDRIKTPLKRKGPKGTLEFEPISWDQAFDEIAGVILNLKDRYGPECIASFFGRGNFEKSMWQMFSPKHPGFPHGNSVFMPLGSPNAFSVSSLCAMSFVALAPTTTFGNGLGLLQPDLEYADIIFLWGANPAASFPLQLMKRIQTAKKRGAKIIAIDPRRSETGKLADQWIPIQPGTDGALINGILRWCFKNGTIDREFGEQYCQGFSELEEYVDSFTPEYVEAVTRVSQDTIRMLGEVLTSPKRVSFVSYTGLEYSDTGVQSIRGLNTLIALTGNLDVEGGQRFVLPAQVPLRKPDVFFPTDVDPIGMDVYPIPCKYVGCGHFMEFPRSVLDGDPYKVRFLMIGGASILTSFPNTGLFRKALEALDYLVSVDIFLNADCMVADMVLPATTYFEDASFCGYPALAPPVALQYRRKMIEPVGESMGSYLIFAKLAERLGYGHLYPQTEDEMVDYVIGDLPFSLDEFKERSKQGPVFMVPEKEIPVYMRGGEEKKWVSGRLRPDSKPGFPTPSGKWEIASTTLESYGFAPLPEYAGVKEGPENQALAKDFPLTLMTGARLRSTFRSQHLNIPGLLKRQPKAEAVLHPNDAAPRGIESGDTVALRTPRGEVTLCARVTENIFEGVVEANMGGGSPIQGEGWKNSNVNLVTDDKHRDPISGFPIFKALLCELEKVGGEE